MGIWGEEWEVWRGMGGRMGFWGRNGGLGVGKEALGGKWGAWGGKWGFGGERLCLEVINGCVWGQILPWGAGNVRVGGAEVLLLVGNALFFGGGSFSLCCRPPPPRCC